MKTIWTNIPPAVQDRMIRAYADYAAERGHDDRASVMRALADMEDDELREHLQNGIDYVIEDEHDRPVDIQHVGFTLEYERSHDASFQDLAHALVLAQDCLQDRIERLTTEKDKLADTIHALGALTPEGRQHWDNLAVMIVRLRMSHARLAETLLQRDEDTFHEGDGWLTRQADVWMRG